MTEEMAVFALCAFLNVNVFTSKSIALSGWCGDTKGGVKVNSKQGESRQRTGSYETEGKTGETGGDGDWIYTLGC